MDTSSTTTCKSNRSIIAHHAVSLACSQCRTPPTRCSSRLPYPRKVSPSGVGVDRLRHTIQCAGQKRTTARLARARPPALDPPSRRSEPSWCCQFVQLISEGAIATITRLHRKLLAPRCSRAHRPEPGLTTGYREVYCSTPGDYFPHSISAWSMLEIPSLISSVVTVRDGLNESVAARED